MAWGWKWIADITGPPGDAAALGRFEGIDYNLALMEPFLLVPSVDNEYAIPFTDEGGATAGGVLMGGTFNFERPPSVAGMGGVTFQPVYAAGRAFLYVDKDGYVASEVLTDGSTVTHKGKSAPALSLSVGNDALGYTLTRRDLLSTIGDSLTEGFWGGVPAPGPDSWPSKLAALLGTAVTVTNLGTTGYTVDEEAIKIGALPVPLTVTGGSIPASGSVVVTTTAVIGWVQTSTRSFVGSLSGVPGTFQRTSTGMTFTRTTAGTAKAVPAGTPFVSDFAGHDTEILFILLGRNNVSNNVKGSDLTVAAHVIKGVKRIVDWQSRDLKKVVVISVTNRQDETSGTAGHSTVLEINAGLEAEYGPRFLNFRDLLVNDVIHALGITPSPADLTAMANDAPPASVMDDNTHWSKDTHTFMATLAHGYLTDRDWTAS